jgi:hypothetical protein
MSEDRSMRRRNAGRLVSIFALVGVFFVLVASCGGAGGDVSGGVDASTFDAFNPGSFSQDGNGGTGGSTCAPATCASLGYDCGVNADGCGGTVDCGTCSGGDMCGVGGYSKCGNPLTAVDGGAVCVPKTCADYGANACGQQSDLCGGLTANCGTCATPEFCGGGGPGVCGGDINTTPDGGPRCVPATCASLGYDCGMAGDGCGGTVGPCGTGTCTSPQFCGGGGPNKCGGSTGVGTDGGTLKPCIPKTCAALGAGCGIAGDGCGGTTPLCGTCVSPQYCGGGGASKCGGNNGMSADGGVICTPKTCASYGANACGQQSDGCGGLTVNCGGCVNPQFCGGGGAGKCGGNDAIGPDGGPILNCKPATCASLGYNCGLAADGCGGTIGPCGAACTPPAFCGGAQPNQCGTSGACTGLCQKQVKCDGGTTTTLTGIVRAGLQESTDSGGNSVLWVPQNTVPDPVPGVLVYIPTTPVLPFDNNPAAPQVACSQCGADVTGSPLVTATTDYNGKFTLTNVPVSASATDTIPIVIQLGKWRRQYAFAITKSCTANALPQDLNLPSRSSEGDIPLTAISTGSYDPIECVLLKMGVAQNEFMSPTTWAAETVPAGSTAPRVGRIHIYTASQSQASGNGSPGAQLPPVVDETALLGAGGSYLTYDQMLLPCWGEAITKTGTELANLATYGTAGGHFFATHYSYSWLNTNTNQNLSSIANWDPKQDVNDTNPVPNGVNFTGNVSNTVPVTAPVTNPGMFVKWLNYVGALANSAPPGGGGATPPTAATVTITAGRHDVDSVANHSVDWIDGTDPNPSVSTKSQMLLHFTFDMPVPGADGGVSGPQCGHGIYSDFHVVSSTQSNGKTFPAECDATALNSQERIIEYMIWDLASCVPGPPTCTPKTCADFPGTCGQQGDTCGGLTANCGTCGPGLSCGGGGVANHCGAPDGGACTALTCSSYPMGTCGAQTNGCGGTTPNCSNCPAGQSCGGGGTPGLCGSPPGDTCTPLTCAAYPGVCGQQSDGCGGLTPDCNPCPAGQTCGGGGTPGVCGSPPGNTCVPLTCAEQNIDCGPAGDGCGNVLASCGTCPTPQTCGGGGVAGQCGGMNTCVPVTCASQNIACGPAGDGCGNLIQGGCGTCTPPQTCGGGGVPGQCGGMKGCVPETCQDLNIDCGPAGDGCGNLIPSCGTCTPPETCGGGGGAGRCGASISK